MPHPPGSPVESSREDIESKKERDLSQPELSRRRATRKLRIVAGVAPLVTFILGIVAQLALQDWIYTQNTITLGLFIVAVTGGIVAILVALQIRWHSTDVSNIVDTIEEHKRITSDVLSRLETSSELSVHYVADAGVGASYRRAAEVISRATDSITFVDFWEPYEKYQMVAEEPIASNTKLAREEYYKAIQICITRNCHTEHTFHRRVIQVPAHLLDGGIPFSIDPAFHSHLKWSVEQQQQHPIGCKLRLSPSLIRLPFAIVDKQFIIMPVLSQDAVTKRQTRYGALFFEDREGLLYKCLRNMYQVIESRSRPLVTTDFA